MQWANIPDVEEGVLCGADAAQEWLLPWWWDNYRACNQYPVTFVDFGMTQTMRQWCEKQGEVLSLSLAFQLQSECKYVHDVRWKQLYGKRLLEKRAIWFQKPFALLASPYRKTLWLDVDCEVLGSLAPLFSYENLGLVREFFSNHLPVFHPDIQYNSGVILSPHGTRVIELWAKEALLSNHQFLSDDWLLSSLIAKYKIEIDEISPLYNWRISHGFNLNAIIMHWMFEAGKEYLRKHGGFKPIRDQFYKQLLHCLPRSNP